MYWKVQKVGPAEFLRAYGVHVALAFSLVCNLILFASAPKKSLPTEVKQNVEAFARQVTTHLLDTSYIVCESNVTALVKELAPNVANMLRKEEMLPRTQQDLKALTMDMAERKQICSVRIDRVSAGDPDPKGLIPVEVSGVCAIHSASETGERPFRFIYMLGTIEGNLVVADWRDLSPQG